MKMLVQLSNIAPAIHQSEENKEVGVFHLQLETVVTKAQLDKVLKAWGLDGLVVTLQPKK